MNVRRLLKKFGLQWIYKGVTYGVACEICEIRANNGPTSALLEMKVIR